MRPNRFYDVCNGRELSYDRPFIRFIAMHPLVLALVLCGTTLLVFFLVCLLPTERKIYTARQAFEHSMERTRYYISLLRRESK
jgi:hypothetical protein